MAINELLQTLFVITH